MTFIWIYHSRNPFYYCIEGVRVDQQQIVLQGQKNVELSAVIMC